MSMKRKNSINGKAKKRQKVEETEILAENDLQWKEVQLPDHLEDAEGFLGLEVIEDVEIIKTGNKAGIQFKAKKLDATNEKSKPKSKTEKKKPSQTSSTKQVKSIPTDEEEEWEGFDEIPKPKGILKEQVKAGAGKKEKAGRDRAGAGKKDAGQGEEEDEEEEEEEDGLDGTGFSLLPDIQEVNMSEWKDLDLSPSVLDSLSNLGFTKPTLIQKSCIPDILSGHDVIGKASTGSGKTLAYGIPILQTKSTALILSPTRELAHQISKHLTDLFEGTDDPPRIATVTGGLSIQKQQRLLSTASVIVATPGRLWEVIESSSDLLKKLKKVQMLVVDEADRLLSDGHFEEVGKIIEIIEKKVIDDAEDQVEDEQDAVEEDEDRRGRQILVFSATFQKSLQQKLAGRAKMLNNEESLEYLTSKLPFSGKPKFIDVNPTSQMVKTLKEGVIECGAMEKDLYLYAVLLQNPKRTLVFTNSISSVRRLTGFLSNLGVTSVALHSTMPQKARLRSVEKFSTSGSILVATDVAARGLDIKGIELVIHYHVPRTADMYVHRSGRTARAEAVGKSILLCSPDELAGVTRLIAKVHTGGSLTPIGIDRTLVNRLNPRVKLSQKLTEATQSKEKVSSQDNWLHKAAEDLGVDYDSEEFAQNESRGSRGRNKDKNRKILSKEEISSLRAQLKDQLNKRINLGVSEKYLAGGSLDVNELLRDRENGIFLGKVEAINF